MTTTTRQDPLIKIQELEITTGQDFYTVLRHSEVSVEDSGGEDYGTIAVQIAVDHQFDIVTCDLGRTTDIAGLERAIEALTLVKDRLIALYGDDNALEVLGPCLGSGNWGRCKLGYYHGGDHEFPTEDEGRTAHQIGAVA